MPGLSADPDESPVREIGGVYGTTAEEGGRGEQKNNQGGGRRDEDQGVRLSWRRAFGCSVDVCHVCVALKRIEKGCRDAGKTYVPSKVWGGAVGLSGEEGGEVSAAKGTKLTLERLWYNVTKDAYFNGLFDRVLSGEELNTTINW